MSVAGGETGSAGSGTELAGGTRASADVAGLEIDVFDSSAVGSPLAAGAALRSTSLGGGGRALAAPIRALGSRSSFGIVKLGGEKAWTIVWRKLSGCLGLDRMVR